MMTAQSALWCIGLRRNDVAHFVRNDVIFANMCRRQTSLKEPHLGTSEVLSWRRARDSNPRNRFDGLHDFQSCSFDQLGQLSKYSFALKFTRAIIYKFSPVVKSFFSFAWNESTAKVFKLQILQGTFSGSEILDDIQKHNGDQRKNAGSGAAGNNNVFDAAEERSRIINNIFHPIPGWDNIRKSGDTQQTDWNQWKQNGKYFFHSNSFLFFWLFIPYSKAFYHSRKNLSTKMWALEAIFCDNRTNLWRFLQFV